MTKIPPFNGPFTSEFIFPPKVPKLSGLRGPLYYYLILVYYFI